MPVDYEAYYRPKPGSERSAEWRQLSAELKADHALRLLKHVGTRPASVLEVGCGDGAVLSALAHRGLGPELVGLELSETAASYARERPEVTSAVTFDGITLPFEDSSFELVLATHVLEHVDAPARMVAEMSRVAAPFVIVEVPLERNLSARRAAAAARSEAAGHVQRFSRADVHKLLSDAGLLVIGELTDRLPRSVFTYQHGRARGTAKWFARTALGLLLGGGKRLITVHFAAIAVASQKLDR